MGFDDKKKELENAQTYDIVRDDDWGQTVTGGLKCWFPLKVKANKRKHAEQKKAIEKIAKGVQGVKEVEISNWPVLGVWRVKVHIVAAGDSAAIAKRLFRIFNQH